MAFTGAFTSGNNDGQNGMGGVKVGTPKVRVTVGKSKLFVRKNPGSPGKLGRTSNLSESLSKLRGKGAIG